MEVNQLRMHINIVILFLFLFLFISCNTEVYKRYENKYGDYIVLKKDGIKTSISKQIINKNIVEYKISIFNYSRSPIYIDTTLRIVLQPEINTKVHNIIELGVSLHKLQVNLSTALIKISFLESYTKKVRMPIDSLETGFYFYYIRNGSNLNKNTIEKKGNSLIVPKSIVFYANEVYLGWFNAQKKDYNNQILYIFDEKDKKIPKK